jgi:hypothetical protein
MLLHHRFRSATRVVDAYPGLTLAAFTLVITVLTFGSAGAQVNGYTFFLERSYFLWEPILEDQVHAPDYYKESYVPENDDLLFEAQVAPHIFLLNTLDDELDQGGLATALSFTPLMVVRQLRGFSRPLKNPSFMPKVNLQVFWVPRPGQSGTTWLWGLQAIWGHHSNGGAGCLFVEESAVDGTCAVSDSIPPEDRQVDTSGSFSTTYGRFELLAKRMRVVEGVSQGGFMLGGGLDVNGAGWPFLIFGGGATGDLRRIYGPTRVRAMAELDRLHRFIGMDLRATIGARVEHIIYDRKPSPDASQWTWMAEAMLTKDSGNFRGLGLYARYYEGQDYYNLLFIRDIRRLQVGLVLDPTNNRWTK